MTAAAQQHIELEEFVEESRERISRRLRGRERLATLLGAGLFLTAAIPLATLTHSARSPSPAVVVALLLAYALASRVEFEIGTGSAIPTQLVFIPMLFALPAGTLPLLAALGLVAGSLPDIHRGRMHGERLLVQLVGSWHTLGPAVVLLVAGEPDAALGRWPVLAAAFAAQMVVDFGSAALRAAYVFGMTIRELARVMASVYAVDAALTPVAFAVAVVAVDAPAAALLGIPLVGLLAIFARERQGRIDAALELSHAYRGTALLLGDVVEADDAYTGSHSRDVVELVLSVADELGLNPRQRRDAELAALLHDVGKIRIPNAVINKPGPLTAEERELIETHTVEGERLLGKVGGMLGEVGRIVRSCHERWDGAGYPDGLADEQIPLIARIVMCCDAYNAMTTDRSYRAALSQPDALAELEQNAGTQFDPAVVDVLVRHVRG